MKHLIWILLGILFLQSCDVPIDISNQSNLIIHEKTYSPDSSKYLIRYSYDEGALGSCCNQTSILKVSDSLAVLNDFIIPSVFENPYWISNNEINADIHMLELLSAKGDFDPSFPELKIQKINDVSLQKNVHNLVTEKDQKQIKFSKISPNNKLVLYGYEYLTNEVIEDSVLHISIVPNDSKIPDYGNVYIVISRMYNQIASVDWISNDTITITVKNEDLNYGQMEFFEIYKTVSYPEIVKNIKKTVRF